MKINRISLKERITRLRNGYPSDMEFVISSIRTMAVMPITIYLGSDSAKLKS